MRKYLLLLVAVLVGLLSLATTAPATASTLSPDVTKVSIDLKPRCFNGRVGLAYRLTNGSQLPVNVSLKLFGGTYETILSPGQTRTGVALSHEFEIDAGRTIARLVSGDETAHRLVSYPAFSCK